MVIPNLHLAHQMCLTVLYHCQNSKPYPFAQPDEQKACHQPIRVHKRRATMSHRIVAHHCFSLFTPLISSLYVCFAISVCYLLFIYCLSWLVAAVEPRDHGALPCLARSVSNLALATSRVQGTGHRFLSLVRADLLPTALG